MKEGESEMCEKKIEWDKRESGRREKIENREREEKVRWERLQKRKREKY